MIYADSIDFYLERINDGYFKLEENGNIYRLKIRENQYTIKACEPKIADSITKSYKRLAMKWECDEYRIFSHRLIYTYFIGEIPNEYVINHKDGNKLNNSIYNLEAITQSENMKHAYDIGLHKKYYGVKHHNAKVNENQLTEIRTLINLGFSDMNIGKIFDISRFVVGNIRRNKTYYRS